MRLRYSVVVLCGFLIVVVGIFCVVSCRAQNASAHETKQIEISEPLGPGYFLAVDLGEDSYIPAFLVPDTDVWPDFIMAAYRDPEFQEEVLSFFCRLTGSLDVAKVVLSNTVNYDIAPALAFALCWEESRYNPRAFNRNRNETLDRGLFQLNSGTFPKLSVDDFYDLEINARYGLSHLRWCLDSAGTDIAGLAMYNAGHNRVRSSGTPKTTLDYISRILRERRRIEGLFLAEYTRVVHTETVEEEPIQTGFRLSLLTPLGGR